jgi:hypothetical protein
MSVENNECQQSAAEIVIKSSLLSETIRKVMRLIFISITCLKKYMSHIYSPYVEYIQYDRIKPF